MIVPDGPIALIINKIQRQMQIRRYSSYQPIYDRDLKFLGAASTYPGRNSLYSYMHHYFHHHCPKPIHEHRRYYSLEQRGFGEDASKYRVEIDYYADVLNSFKHFNLPGPKLLKALSTDAEAVEYISDEEWDLIYVDGGHDFETALGDYRLCKNHLAPNGILVLDDASLDTDYHPPSFSFAGHPGPSRVAREYADKEMRFLCAVGHNNIYQKL